MKYIIMADGEGKRWNNYLGVPKHLIEFNNETLLERTVRLLRKNKVCLGDIIIMASDSRYGYAYIVSQSCKDCEIDRFDEKITDETICYLYGDVYYTEEAMSSIVKQNTDDIFFFGNQSELFAIKVINTKKFFQVKNLIKQKFLKGEIERCIGWEIFRYYNNMELQNFDDFYNILQEQYPNFKNFLAIDDLTTDFDYPSDYHNFIRDERLNKINIYSNYRGDDWINPYINFTHSLDNVQSILDYQVPRDKNIFRQQKNYIHNLWLIEPRTTSDLVDSPGAYEFVYQNYKLWDNIFTHDSKLLTLPNAHLAIWGGAHSWNDCEKTKDISIISSDKEHCPLHIARKNLAYYMKENSIGDTYGTFDGGPRIDAEQTYAQYKFAIAIENYIDDYWFTEKICNCFSNKTVPIYIGAKKINEFFNKDGIIQCDNIGQIKELLKNFDYDKEYKKRKKAIDENYERVKEFRNCFCYLYKNYKHLLGGKNE